MYVFVQEIEVNNYFSKKNLRLLEHNYTLNMGF